MRNILRLILAVIFVAAAVSYPSGSIYACDSRKFQIKVKPEESFPAEVIDVHTQPPTEAHEFRCGSPPLREKPKGSDVPMTVAIALGGTAIITLLRRRKASMLVMGGTLAGLCAVVGYLWYGL